MTIIRGPYRVTEQSQDLDVFYEALRANRATNLRHLEMATNIGHLAVLSGQAKTEIEAIKVARSTPWGRAVPLFMLRNAMRHDKEAAGPAARTWLRVVATLGNDADQSLSSPKGLTTQSTEQS